MNLPEIEISKLKIHPENDKYFGDIKDNSPDLWEKFKEDIKRKKREPIKINQDYVVVSGNQRVKACRELGIEKWPYVMCEYESYEDEIEDLIIINSMRRNQDPFRKFNQIEFLKSRIESRQGERTDLSGEKHSSKLRPRDEIANILGEHKNFIRAGMRFNSLPKEKQQEIKNEYYSNQNNATKKALQEKIDEFTNQNIRLNNLEAKVGRLSRVKEMKQDRILELESHVKHLQRQEVSKESYYSFISQINTLKNEVDELEKEKQKYVNENNYAKPIRNGLNRIKDFYNREMLWFMNLDDIPLEVRSDFSEKIDDITGMIYNWLNKVEEHFEIQFGRKD